EQLFRLRLEDVRQRAGGAPTPPRALHQAALDGLGEPARYVRADLADGPEGTLADVAEELVGVAPGEGLLAGGELVEGDAQRPDVGAVIGGIAHDHLRRQVGRAAA